MEKVELLRSILVERYGEEKAGDFKEIYDQLQECAELRNDIAHSQWFIQYGTNKDDTATTKINDTKAFARGKVFDFAKASNTVSVEVLEVNISKLQKAGAELNAFFVKLFT